MNCQHIAPLLPLYASEDLTNAQLAQVRAHLTHCEDCAAEAAAFAASLAWSQNIATPEFDETFFADLRYAVRQELAAAPVTSSWVRLRWRLLPAAVALLLLTIFSVRLFQTKGVPQPDLVNVPAFPQLPDATPSPMPLKNELAHSPKSRVLPRKPQHNQLTNLVTKQEEKESAAALATAATSKLKQEDATETTAAPVMSRIEIQTADPNIRIIWLTQNTSRASEPLSR